jgi:hypothetical protein
LLALTAGSCRARKTSLIQGLAGKGAAFAAREAAARRLRVRARKNPRAKRSAACCGAGRELALFFSGLLFHISCMV